MHAETLLAAALGVAPIIYAGRGWARFLRPARWPIVRAVITRSNLVEIDIDIGEGSIKGWEPRIQFTYAVGAERRSGSCISLDEKGFQYTNHLSAQRFIARYPVGQDVPLHLSHEGQAALLADVSWNRKSHYLAWGAFGALVFGLAVFLATLP